MICRETQRNYLTLVDRVCHLRVCVCVLPVVFQVCVCVLPAELFLPGALQTEAAADKGGPVSFWPNEFVSSTHTSHYPLDTPSHTELYTHTHTHTSVRYEDCACSAYFSWVFCTWCVLVALFSHKPPGSDHLHIQALLPVHHSDLNVT